MKHCYHVYMPSYKYSWFSNRHIELLRRLHTIHSMENCSVELLDLINMGVAVYMYTKIIRKLTKEGRETTAVLGGILKYRVQPVSHEDLDHLSLNNEFE